VTRQPSLPRRRQTQRGKAAGRKHAAWLRRARTPGGAPERAWPDSARLAAEEDVAEGHVGRWIDCILSSPLALLGATPFIRAFGRLPGQFVSPIRILQNIRILRIGIRDLRILFILLIAHLTFRSLHLCKYLAAHDAYHLIPPVYHF
jgi:hypothetical protein